MLTNVPSAVNRMARNVVINHPNTIECQVFRKVVTRPGTSVGGLPTMGGLGVIDSDDEEQIEFSHIGNGYALQAESFMPSPMMDRRDANNGAVNEFRFMIEPEHPLGVTGTFEPKSHDVIYLVMSEEIRIAFEVVSLETVLNIPPYAVRYILNRRGHPL